MKKLTVSLLPLVFIIGLSGAEILFYDDFSSGNADSWAEVQTSADYEVVKQNYYQYLTEPTQELRWAASFNGNNEGVMTKENYSMLAEVTIYDGIAWIGTRFSYEFSEHQCELWQGYGLRVSPAEDLISIGRFDDPFAPDEFVDVLSEDCMPLSFGDTYWLRLEVSGYVLKAKVWQGARSDEPEHWPLTCIDSSYYLPGSIGVGSSGGLFLNKYNIVEVADIGTSALEQSTWGAIKSSGSDI